jgi:hypothetical protein
MRDPTPILEPLLLTVDETCRIKGEGRSKVYEKMRAGVYIAVKDGTRTKLTYASVKADAENLPRATFTAQPRRKAGAAA